MDTLTWLDQFYAIVEGSKELEKALLAIGDVFDIADTTYGMEISGLTPQEAADAILKGKNNGN